MLEVVRRGALLITFLNPHKVVGAVQIEFCELAHALQLLDGGWDQREWVVTGSDGLESLPRPPRVDGEGLVLMPRLPCVGGRLGQEEAG